MAPRKVATDIGLGTSVDQAVDRLRADAAQGLTSAEVTQRLVRFGPNALAQAHQRSTLSIFPAQFQRPMVAVLGTTIADGRGRLLKADTGAN